MTVKIASVEEIIEKLFGLPHNHHSHFDVLSRSELFLNYFLHKFNIIVIFYNVFTVTQLFYCCTGNQ